LRIHYVCIKHCIVNLCLCQVFWYWLVDTGQKRPQESKAISRQEDVLSAVITSAVHCLSFLLLLFCLSFLVSVLLLYFSSVVNTIPCNCK
jgi:uncharacterized membrane protein